MTPFNPANPQPGTYDGVPAETYHALDLISASGLSTLDAECPAIYRAEREAPDEPDAKCDLGTAAHLVFLEPADFERKVARLDFDTFQSRAARDARDEARSEGRTPLRVRDFDTVLAMRKALVRQVGDLFVGGVAERTYVWKDMRTGVLCKARPDYVRPRVILDYKTSSSANPRAFRSRLFDCGHHIQAWHYLTGHEALTGERPDWRWIVQATKPPYLVSAFKPTSPLLWWAEQQGRAALHEYARCLRAGSWPGYGDAVFPIDLPSWAQYQLAERSEAGEFKLEAPGRRPKKAVKPADVEKAMKAFAPLDGGAHPLSRDAVPLAGET